MLKDAEYIRIPEGVPIVQSFLNAIVTLRTEELEQMLSGFAAQKGYALNDDEAVYFAAEVPESDPEYFGDRGVAVYRCRPAEDRLTVVLMDEHDFWFRATDVILQRGGEFPPERFAVLKEHLKEWYRRMRNR